MKIEDYIREDLGGGDITSEALLGDETLVASITANEDCILAGLREAEEVFHHLGLKTKAFCKDGERIERGCKVLQIQGRAKTILSGERVALNFLMKMSGIATLTNELVNICRKINPKVKIAATRKTTPGFRFYEKKAVLIGGGDPHRYSLQDSILIKDNHLRVVGSVKEAIRRARKKVGKMKIEVEAETIEDAIEAAEYGADIVMLDNMSPRKAEEAARKVRKIGKVTVEVSGRITPNNIKEYASIADVISLGFITHSYTSKDFSLDIEKTIEGGT